MKIEIISVSPELAAQWLSTNTDKNRRISQNAIRRYAADMIKGEWKLTGEAIKFDTNGCLIDGQHRLSAVVASKKTVNMAVITGLENDIMSVIDTGKSRSAGDALSITGMAENANNIAALARKIIAFNGGTNDVMSSRRIRLKGESITNRDIIEYCKNNDLQPYIRFAFRLCKAQITSIFLHGDWAFIYWLLCKTDPAAAEEFCMRLATLENVSSTSPIRTLFERVAKCSIPLTPKMRLMATVTAWNAWRKGETLRSIKVMNMDDAIPQAV